MPLNGPALGHLQILLVEDSAEDAELICDLLEQAGQTLLDEGSVTVTVSGSATGPVANTVSLKFDTRVTAGALD